MVLESLLNPKNAKNEPLEIFIVAVVYSLLAVVFSYSLFPNQSSILTIAFITILFVPFFQKVFEIEEHEEDEYIKKKKDMENEMLLSRHKKIITSYSAFFLGVVFTLTVVFILFPQFGEVFNLQISNMPSANVVGPSSFSTFEETFNMYLLNNTRVLFLCFAFSVLFGTGAVLILSWNASIISVFLGIKFIHPLIEKGTSVLPAFAHGFSRGFLVIALHGIPEILAYFIAGIGGGILSVGIIREKIGTDDFNNIIMDAFKFIIIAESLIILAAVLETIRFSFVVNIVLVLFEVGLILAFVWGVK